MRAAPCERWREGPPGGEPWRSHVETCPTCAARAPLSEAERTRVRGPAEARFDQLTLRRLRQRVLDDAHRPRAERRHRPPRAAGLAVFAVFVGLVVSVVCAGPPSRRPSAELSVVTSDGADARWSRLVDGDVEVLAFERGAFDVNVRNHDVGRIFVRVPDGEIRDLGTIFRVVVDGARTDEVTVTEGRVALVVRGQPPALLVAGDRWRRPVEPLAPPAPVVPSVLRLHSSSAPAPSNTSAPSSGPAPSNTSAPARAASGLGAEDAAYLHVLALARAGRQSDAREEARRYLRRFPTGFRSDELRDLAGGGAASGAVRPGAAR